MNLYLASNFEDEINNIEPIWNNFKEIVSKWVVVDSGSTDGTQEKLRDIVKDRLILVQSDMIKTNGYGYARTKLVELAEGADWVQIIDGDERMLIEDIINLKKLVNDPKNLEYDVIREPRCHYQNYEMTVVEYGSMTKTGSDWKEAIKINPDWQARLIRRNMINGKSKVQWYRRVHEILGGVTNERRQIMGSPVIRHFGWMKTAERKQQIVNLCDSLWKMDLAKKEYVETYIEEVKAGTSMANYVEQIKNSQSK